MRKLRNPLLKVVMVITIALGVVSCGSDTPTSKEFRYLGLEKNVLLPALNERSIVVYGFGFDTNLSVWELKLTDGTNDIPVTLENIEDTRYGWESVENEFLQKMYCKLPPFGEGDYTLTLKNKITGQSQQVPFLVRSKTFSEVETPAFLATYRIEGKSRDLFFQNTTNTIKGVSTTSIEKIVLENANTFAQKEVSYSVNDQGDLEFTIPQNTPLAIYYLGIYYNSGISSYFDKTMVLLEEQQPIITNINTTTLKTGEELIITGENLRYTINYDLFPLKGLQTSSTLTKLVFSQDDFEDIFSLGSAYYYENYNYINSDFTKLTLPIPSKDDWYIFSDEEKTYYEGEVYLQSGPYKTDPFTLRINF